MAHIIKPAEQIKPEFKVGQLVKWATVISERGSFDGWNQYEGTIIKVCPKNLHVKDNRGNIWSVSKKEVK